MKIIGAILILVSSALLGILSSRNLDLRVKEIQTLRNDLGFLEMEISYSATPLPQIFEKLAEINSRTTYNLWRNLVDLFGNGEGFLAEEAWGKALDNYAKTSSLTAADLEILRNLGLGFGVTGRQEQIKKFQLTHELLKIKQREAEGEREKYQRMWRSMGVLGGLAIIILLY